MGRHTRLLAMAWKELLVLLLDKRARIALIAAPIMQMTLFGYASTLEIKHIDMGYVARDGGIAEERLLADLAGSPNMRNLERYASEDELLDGIERRKILAGLVIPQDLSRRLAQGRKAEVGLLLDGRRTNSSQLVASYVSDIASRTGAELRPEMPPPGPQVIATNWYNPALDYLWFTMPALIGMIVTVMVFIVSLLSVSRERELGSFDELMILPLTRIEVLVGKTLPAFVVGLINAAIYVVMIPNVYGVPMHGSLLLLFAAATAYALALTGIGLSISCLSQNQQQSFLGGFLVMVPLMLLSGFASPVDNMPGWLQILCKANPVLHMQIICEGIFLKNMGAATVFAHIWPMLLVSCATLPMAAWLFRARSA